MNRQTGCALKELCSGEEKEVTNGEKCHHCRQRKQLFGSCPHTTASGWTVTQSPAFSRCQSEVVSSWCFIPKCRTLLSGFYVSFILFDSPIIPTGWELLNLACNIQQSRSISNERTGVPEGGELSSRAFENPLTVPAHGPLSPPQTLQDTMSNALLTQDMIFSCLTKLLFLSKEETGLIKHDFSLLTLRRLWVITAFILWSHDSP